MTFAHHVSRLVIWMIPAIGAVVAVLAIVPWGLGIPGTSDAAYADGWWRGVAAILGYLSAYGVACILWIVAKVFRLPPLATLAHLLVWIALLIAAATLYIAFRMMLEAP